MVGKSTGHPRRPEGAIIDRVSTKEASIRKENFTYDDSICSHYSNGNLKSETCEMFREARIASKQIQRSALLERCPRKNRGEQFGLYLRVET